MRNSKKLILAFSMLAIAIAFSGSAFAADKMDKMAADKHTSTKFEGPKANAGTVTHSKKDGKNVLTLSEDFVVPDTPDPHWQVVDSKGTVYLLDRLKLKGLQDPDLHHCSRVRERRCQGSDLVRVRRGQSGRSFVHHPCEVTASTVPLACRARVHNHGEARGRSRNPEEEKLCVSTFLKSSPL